MKAKPVKTCGPSLWARGSSSGLWWRSLVCFALHLSLRIAPAESDKAAWVKTKMTSFAKTSLLKAMQTQLAGGQDAETIFEFENDAYSCRPKDTGGDVFDPSSYTCSATCKLVDDDPSSGVGVLYHKIVDEVLPTLHAMRSLKTAMTGREAIGEDLEITEDPAGGIAFAVNFLHAADNPVCALTANLYFIAINELFRQMEKLLLILKKVPVAQVKVFAKIMHKPVKTIAKITTKAQSELEELCDATLRIHIALLVSNRQVTSALSTLDQYSALMLPPLVEAACVSANTFTAADDLVAGLGGGGSETRARRSLAAGGGTTPTTILPISANSTLHDRRHFAASLAPSARDLPVRRFVMYSDWEQASALTPVTGEQLRHGVVNGRHLAVKESAEELTNVMLDDSVTAMNVFLAVFSHLDDVFRTFGQIWVDVAMAAQNFFDALENLYETIVGMLPVFDLMFDIGNIFSFLTCPKAFGFVCFIDELISEAVNAIISAFENLIGFSLMDLIERLIELLGLPDISFSFPDLLPDPLPWEPILEEIAEKVETLVEDALGVFIDDPLPALYEQNSDDTTGLDVLYAGVRRETTVGIQDCADVYTGSGSTAEKRLPLMFHAVQRSAWCPGGYDFSAASLYPCGGLGDIDLLTGDDCKVSSDAKVPLVCVNENYPDQFYKNGELDFPYWMPSRGDFILQAHYACARESTVYDLGLLPAEIITTQGNGVISCATKRFAVDYAEIGKPCLDQEFLDDTRGARYYENKDACSTITMNEAPSGSNNHFTQLDSYLDLFNAQVAAHEACNGNHRCLVGVWIKESNIKAMLADLVPTQLSSYVDSMVTQHLALYEWGTSNPIYSNLNIELNHPSGVSGSSAPSSFRNADSSSSTHAGSLVHPSDSRAFTQVICGQGSYLEKFHWQQYRKRRYKGRGSEDTAQLSFACYGDRSSSGVSKLTLLGSGYSKRGNEVKMDCSGERGGFQFISTYVHRTSTDNDDFSWRWKCMNGDTGAGGHETDFSRTAERTANCGSGGPIQSLDYYWTRDQRRRKFWGKTEYDFVDYIKIGVHCAGSTSPLEQSRSLEAGSFISLTRLGSYLAREDEWVSTHVVDVPDCQSGAIANAEECNALALDGDASTECTLPSFCDKSDVRYYCPVPGVDIDLPEPELVANSFGDHNLADALVECPSGMVYSALEVTQGVPPFGGENALEDFIASGCDGTSSSCVYTSPEGESARIVYQCLCGEGFRPLTNDANECEPCPVGTHRPFITSDSDSGADTMLADSCLSCPAGTHGAEVDGSLPTCQPCPKNTYSDKIGAIGSETCVPCLAGYYTEADFGSTSEDECIECGENFECTLEGERNACPVGTWTAGDTMSITCVECPPGTFWDSEGATCSACPQGTYNELYAQTECFSCPAGMFGRATGATVCEACPQGTYQDEEGAIVCEECDPLAPYTDTVQTTSASGCWSEDSHSAIDMAIDGRIVVAVNGTADSEVVVDLLEAGLLAWAGNWSSAVLPGDKVVVQPASITVVAGDEPDQYVMTFKADVANATSSEVMALQQASSSGNVLTKCYASIAQFVSDDPDTNIALAKQAIEQSITADVLASHDLILPPAVIDYQSPELVDLSCEELLTRFTDDAALAIWEVGDGFCNGGAWNTPQCRYDGGDCCSNTCTPVSAAYLASASASSDSCLADEVGDGYCDYDNNNEACGWDGGDCCESTCEPGSGGDCDEDTFDCRDGTEQPSDTEPRDQSCAPRTMICLDPAADTRVGWSRRRKISCSGKRQRSLLSDDLEHEEASSRPRNRRRLAPAERVCGSPVVTWGDGVCDAELNTEACEYDGGDCCAQTCVLNPLYPASCAVEDCLDPAVTDDSSAWDLDEEAPVLNNVPAQDPPGTSYECAAPAAPRVIASDNDPCFESREITPTERTSRSTACRHTLTRTWAVKDLHLNLAREARTYSVVDTEAPLLAGLPLDNTVLQTNDPAFTFGPGESVTAVDTCSGAETTVTYSEEEMDSDDECTRIVARSWTAEDLCGNTATETRTATVEYTGAACGGSGQAVPTPAPTVANNNFVTASPTVSAS